MTDFDWDPFLGDRWSPESVGDQIVGTITHIEAKDGKAGTMPVLTLDEKETGRSVEVWASQTMLKQSLAEQRPQVGDSIAIKLTELRQTGQPSPMKVFAVRLKRADTNNVPLDEDGLPADLEEPF